MSESLYVTRYGRFWAVYEHTVNHDDAQTLVCVTVYRKGAREVVRRLQPPDPPAPDHNDPSAGPGSSPGPSFRQTLTAREETDA